MKNYLVKLHKNVTDCYYTTVYAIDLEEACKLAEKLAEGIMAAEYYDSNKHDYAYDGEYTNCFAYVIQEL